MCGILAYHSSQSPCESENFREALRRLSHRGPDAENIWYSTCQKIALGHRLLHLTGTTPAPQPLSNEDRTIQAIVNGEFYQYTSTRTLLEERGHHFASDSDSELLIHLYEEYGCKCLTHLNGEFAFILWDSKNEKLFCARDRFGIKPLHYFFNGKTLLLSSEAKALLTYGIEGRWNEQALAQAFTHQYLAPNESLFAGIQQIPPAHFLEFSENQISLKCYWTPERKPQPCEPEELIFKLNEAVTERCHDKAAFSLSGGIDSSLVVNLAHRHLGRTVPAFTVRFEHKDYDEIPFVEETSSQLGSEIEIVNVSQSDLLNDLPYAVTNSEGLSINGQLIGKHRLNHAIHQAGYKAVLSGEGADEALLGYAHLLVDHSQKRNRPSLSSPQKGIMLPPPSFAIPNSPPLGLLAWPTFLQAKSAFCQKLHLLLAPDFAKKIGSRDHLHSTLSQIEYAGYLSPQNDHPHQCAMLWTRLALSGYILKTLGDGCEMSHSIEGRLPFLDHHFFEFAWSLPTEQKIKNDSTKVILRKAATKLIPKKIALREKHPFLAPPLLSNEKQINRIEETLQSTLLKNVSFLDQKTILNWFQTIKRGSSEQKKEADPILYLILSCLHLQDSYQLSL